MQNSRNKQMVTQGSVIYAMAFIGAFIYYLQHTMGFWPGVVGFLKALIWPGILVYRIMEFLKL
ncbi:hypothetical protein ACTHGU_08935 [Chitinophagaceae bacterium MMS25-I14]